MGARPGKAGVSGVHTHMTNSLNTPAEALEYAYPLRVRRYSLAAGTAEEAASFAVATASCVKSKCSPIAKSLCWPTVARAVRGDWREVATVPPESQV